EARRSATATDRSKRHQRTPPVELCGSLPLRRVGSYDPDRTPPGLPCFRHKDLRDQTPRSPSVEDRCDRDPPPRRQLPRGLRHVAPAEVFSIPQPSTCAPSTGLVADQLQEVGASCPPSAHSDALVNEVVPAPPT